jgi:hypothetical protein
MLLLSHRIVFAANLSTITSEYTAQDGGGGYQHFNGLTFALASYDRARYRDRSSNTTTGSHCISTGSSFSIENKLIAF